MVRESGVPAVRAHALEALTAIRHRMELRAEEAHEAVLMPQDLERESEGDEPSVRFWIRLRSRLDYFMGLLWLALGSMRRATVRFEQAAARRARWALPLISLGNALQRRAASGRALAVYRRALEANRHRLEQNPGAISRVAAAFLARAEELQRDGRDDIALGLLEEANGLDLRRARSAMRFELRRQLERLRGAA